MQTHGISHGDYRPNQILLTEGANDDGQIQFADNGLVGQFRNNYLRTFSGAGKGYLTPYLMKAYAKLIPSPEYDVYKTDVYSLGMTLLYAATLKDPNHHFYDWISKEVNYKQIERAVEDISERYSKQFTEYILAFLEEDDDLRADFAALSGHQVGLATKPVLTGSVLPPIKTAPRIPVPPPVQYKPAQYQSYVPPVQSYVPPVLNQSYAPPVQSYVPPVLNQAYAPPLQSFVPPVLNKSYAPPVHVSQPYGQPLQSYIQPPQFTQSYAQPLQGSMVLPQSQPLYVSQQAQAYGGIRYVNQPSPVKRFENVEDLSDLDRRVQEAIRTTEETINRNSQIPNLVETQVLEHTEDRKVGEGEGEEKENI